MEQLTGEDATFIVDDGRDRTELRLDSLRLNSSLSPSHDRLSVKIEARSGSNALALRLAAESPGQLLEDKPVRIEATVEPGGALQSPVTIAGNLQLAGPVVKMDGIAGTFERGRVGGSLSVSFARAKPFVDADVDVERLDLTAIEPTVRAPSNAEAKPEAGGGTTDVGRGGNWSNRTINLGVLRVFEGNARVAAREIVLDKVHLGPANLEATLLEDNLSVVLTRSDLYGGQGKGELTFDVTQQQPRLGLRFDLSGVNVLPILTDAADFRYVDGHGAAKFDLKAAGESPLAIVSSLEGTASFVFQDGELRGLNLPHMLRSLLETVLSGWQTNASDRTKFSSFAASFRIKDGQARTDDLRFVGPFVRVTGSGNANLVDKTLDFRLDPKLVTSSAAPTSGAESGSIGVPVLVNGPWSKPQIYADLPGILTNPAAALGKLRAGDKALPGGAGNLTKQLDDLIGGRDGGGLGDLLKQLIPR
ncbi:MAG TPA: AsmA-like C-terminal region-containing protein [Xanthobacteraceae bacterium]|nr:AsmA-like C-terminal region-containing protein [Xanthobacteraceae bacterium]